MRRAGRVGSDLSAPLKKDRNMFKGFFRLTLLVAAIGLFAIPLNEVQAEDTAELAEVLKDTTVTLQDGLKSSERDGQPISAQFEIEHGAFQLSIYTVKGDDFMEVIVDPKSGAIVESDKI